MVEMWKDIPGFPGYQLSNLCNLRSCRVKNRTGVYDSKSWRNIKLSKQGKDNHQYLKIRLQTSEGERVSFLAHRLLYTVFVKKIPAGMQVDHIDRNSLNNSLNNLRLATHSQNCRNGRARRKNKYKGLRKTKSGKWAVQIVLEGCKKHLGTFPTIKAAAQVYDTVVRKHYGEYAFINNLI